MNRQEAFEKAYADAHNLPLETFAQYRMGDTYRLPLIAKCWRFYCHGWDAGTDKTFVSVRPHTKMCFACGQTEGHGGLPCPKYQAESITIHGVPYK